MALSIGQVNFGVDAQTDGLRKAISQLDAFQRATTKVARTQTSSAQSAAKAMSRQESAIKGAFQQTLKLQQAIRKAQGKPEDIARTTQAFQRLTKEMTSGRLSAVEFTRSMDAFTAKMNRSRRALADLKADRASKSMSRLTEIVRDLESASVLAVGPLSGLGARIRAIGAITNRSTLALAAFFGAVAAGVVAVTKLTGAAINASRVFEGANARFLAASGSLEIAEKQMAFVIQTSRELGLRIDTSAKAFSRLTAATRGTALEGKGTRDIFLGVSRAAAALRLQNTEVEGTFRAIEQIMSKGSVQAEELRGQLGERLPGAFRLAAEAMGVTTQALGDMLKNGEVLADDFLPKFVEALNQAFGDRAASNLDSFQGSLNDLSSAALLFAKEFDAITGISKVTIGAMKALTAAIDFLRRNLRTLALILGTVTGALLGLAAPAILTGLATVGKLVAALAKGVAALNVALLANPFGAVAASIGKLALALTGAVAGFFGMKSILKDTEKSLAEMDAALDEVAKDSLTDIGNLTQAFTDLDGEVKDLIRDTNVYREVLGFIGRINAPELLLTRFQTLNKVTNLNQKELSELASTLSKALGTDVARDIESVAEALFRFTIEAQNAEKEFDNIVERNKNTEAVMEKVNDELETMGMRLRALRQGSASAEFFDEITSKVDKFRKQFEDTNVAMSERIRLTAEFRRALIETIALEKEHEAIEKALRDAERDAARTARKAARRQEKIAEGILDTNRAMDLMRDRLRALARGPRSLEIFEQVTEPVANLRAKLMDLGVPMQEVNALTAQYGMLLQETLELQNLLSGAAKQSSDAIVNSLEDIITKTESVGDALRNLARELFRVFLRATLLDPLRDSLISTLGGLFSGGGAGAAAATGGGGGFFGGRFQGGGSFTVPGSGGPDSKRISFDASPGEEVMIRRPDQRRGGSNLTIQINAPGADAGTVARIREMIRTEMAPQLVRAATQNTITQLRRPKFV